MPYLTKRRMAWLIGLCSFVAIVLLASCYWFSPRFADISYQASPLAVTATPTRLASDGTLVRETFDLARLSRLGTRDDAQARFAVEDGNYVIELRQARSTVWSVIGEHFSDIAIMAECVQDSASSAAGIVFRFRDTANFYLFQVADDGYYSLDLLNNMVWVTLIDWTYDEAIAAEGQLNRIRVELRDDRIALFVNEQMLEETSDASWTGGDAGLALSTFDSERATLRCDSMTITST
jgi:hypothetical protein